MKNNIQKISKEFLLFISYSPILVVMTLLNDNEFLY
jgi:hypothetical protein